ncbi:unnamed protein product [Thelazia callipaeda]|uniref:WD_REPEATS_REGION domain-containing protein n=1 Tax=Thelazia callipaeda TaxID=103827 RepID=A0A0N5D879_THECL|nr:unnamed protein product [Thelazia callipaeda]
MGANNTSKNIESKSSKADIHENHWGSYTGSFLSKNPRLANNVNKLRMLTASMSGCISSDIPIQIILKNREVGHRPCIRTSKGYFDAPENPSGPFLPCDRASIVNRYLPNRKTIIEKIESKTFCCLYLPGRKLVTASQDDKLRLYIRDENLMHKYKLVNNSSVPDVGWSIIDLATNSDGTQIACSAWSESSKFSSRFSQSTIFKYFYFNGIFRFAYFSLRYTMDDLRLIAGGSDGYIYIFSHVHPQLQLFQAHEGDVNAIHCMSQDPNIFCSGGDDGLCKVWDIRILPSKAPVGVFAGHRHGITYIDGHGNGKYILTNSKDQTVKIWDLRKFSSSYAEKQTLRATQRQTWDYRYQDVPRFFNLAKPMKIIPFFLPPIYCIKGDGSLMTFRGHSVRHTLIRAKFSPERTGFRYVYCGSTEGTLYIFDILTGEYVRMLSGHKSVVRDCCWHPEENEIVTVAWDGCTMRWYCDMSPEYALELERDSD